MESKVIEKVNECLQKWEGGEIFFDKLDEMLKFDKQILADFVYKVKTEIENTGIQTIASGEIGLCMHNYKIPTDILVPGGLRNGNRILGMDDFIEPGKEYLFLDDSYFSGKTARIIQGEVERCGGKFVGCYVIYDGSRVRTEDVKSIYRYYDYH